MKKIPFFLKLKSNFLKKLGNFLKRHKLIENDDKPLEYLVIDWKIKSFAFFLNLFLTGLIWNIPFTVFSFGKIPFTIYTVISFGLLPIIIKDLKKWVKQDG